MDKSDLTHHISRRFNESLENVIALALQMGDTAERQLTRAMQALVAGDQALAQTVAGEDGLINAMETRIDEECQRILATRGPTASDLRMVLAIHKSAGDFERIGDEAEKVARIAARVTPEARKAGKFREIRNLARTVQQMLHSALEAFRQLDATAAWQTMRMDRAIDREYESIQRQCVTYMMEDRQAIQRALDDMWTVRALERIGDHAKNLCEYVIYVVHGQDIRHAPYEPSATDPATS